MARRFFFVCAGLFLLAGVFALGARSVGAQLPAQQEVAVLSGVVNHGGVIPLPHYQDGTEALESECRWIVSTHRVGVGSPPEGQNFITEIQCSTEGRVVTSQAFKYNFGWEYIFGDANYLIIATRNLSPTPTKRQSFGQIKRQYDSGGGK